MNKKTAFDRSALCLAIASINAPHLLLWEEDGGDQKPFVQLLKKQTLWLSGELTSKSNLERHFNEYDEWRKAQAFGDSLGGRIQDLTCNALYLSLEQIFDQECDDTDLLLQYVDTLMDEIDALEQDSAPMRQYWTEVQSELNALGSFKSLPLPKSYFAWLKQFDVSLFGLSL